MKEQDYFQPTHPRVAEVLLVQTAWHLKIGFILLAVLLLLDAEPPWAAAPFPEGLLEFISADF